MLFLTFAITSYVNGLKYWIPDRVCPVSDMGSGMTEYRFFDFLRHHHVLSRRKYSSREMPAVFKLFLIMETGTSSYIGITIGLEMPGLV